MKSKGIELKALKIASDVLPMGEDVVAMGFPLGQDALKISKGNVAGNEEVDGNICIQSTAPISPGSSGGPLLDGSGEKVVGVNFAKAPEGGEWKRKQVQVPNPELTAIEANAGLYALSKG